MPPRFFVVTFRFISTPFPTAGLRSPNDFHLPLIEPIRKVVAKSALRIRENTGPSMPSNCMNDFVTQCDENS